MRIRIVLSRGQEFFRERVLEAPLAIVGRDPECDVVIHDSAVSKRHAILELSDTGLLVRDIGSRNGIRVNGAATERQLLQHLDVIEIGNHKMHVFDDALLPPGGLNLESTWQGAEGSSPFDETQPGTTLVPAGPVYALRRIDEAPSEIAPLDAVRTVVGAPGKAALIVRRRDKLLLTKLSRTPLNVNGLEVDGTSVAIGAGDVFDVGAVRYELVRTA